MSGREGLGTPPAPPAEEALTAEHEGRGGEGGGGAHPSPVSSAHLHVSPLTSLLLFLLLSHLLSLSLPLPLFIPCCSTHTGPLSSKRSPFFFFLFCPRYFFTFYFVHQPFFFCSHLPAPLRKFILFIYLYSPSFMRAFQRSSRLAKAALNRPLLLRLHRRSATGV